MPTKPKNAFPPNGKEHDLMDSIKQTAAELSSSHHFDNLRIELSSFGTEDHPRSLVTATLKDIFGEEHPDMQNLCPLEGRGADIPSALHDLLLKVYVFDINTVHEIQKHWGATTLSILLQNPGRGVFYADLVVRMFRSEQDFVHIVKGPEQPKAIAALQCLREDIERRMDKELDLRVLSTRAGEFRSEHHDVPARDAEGLRPRSYREIYEEEGRKDYRSRPRDQGQEQHYETGVRYREVEEQHIPLRRRLRRPVTDDTPWVWTVEGYRTGPSTRKMS